jgi:hypothetical protein
MEFDAIASNVFRAAACIALALSAIGCTVDEVAPTAIFQCDPSHNLANPGSGQIDNADCGDGYTCYDAVASIGFAFCAPQCGANGTCPSGFHCTGKGGCIQSCDPGSGDGSCPTPLHCISVKGAVGPTVGACLPAVGVCRSDDDCTSATFDYCFANALRANLAPDAGAPVSFCLESGCLENGAACEPGSTCIKKLLPPVVNAPDICAPDCDHNLECPPSLTCIGKTLPATRSRMCIPGFYDFPCSNDIECLTPLSECALLLDEAPPLDRHVCAVSCTTVDDCNRNAPAPTQNPAPVNVYACRNNHCASFGGLANALFCLQPGKECGPGATCESLVVPTGGGSDGGVLPNCAAGVAVTSGAPPACLKECTGNVLGATGCSDLEQALGAPLTCVDVSNVNPMMTPFAPDAVYGIKNHQKVCVPRLPGLTCDPAASAQNGDNPVCLHGLTCLLPPVGVVSICTKKCGADDDCNSDANGLVLGPGFACLGAVCVPRTPSGRPPPGNPMLCMDPIHQLRNGVCVSASGRPCDDGSECLSGVCNLTCAGQGTCQ